MKTKVFTLLIVCLCSSLGFAAQVYGTLRQSGRPVPNVTVEVLCGNSTYSAVTDNYGSYRLFAKETGRCTLRARYQNQLPSAPIDSYNDPAHYDFDLILQGNQYQLVRK
jgi:hypothetical protein